MLKVSRYEGPQAFILRRLFNAIVRMGTVGEMKYPKVT